MFDMTMYLVVNLDLQIRKIEAALEYAIIYLKPPNSIYLWIIQQQSLGFKSGSKVQSGTCKNR